MIPRVSILDLDVGQSEVGLPATIALGTATHPVKSLCETEPQALCFVGSITPAPVTEKILTGVQKLLALTGRREGPLVVNTDGWVEGDGALQYKVRLADAVRPDATILMGENDKTRRLIEEAAQRSRILKVEKPSFAYTRSREERKRLREQAYYRHLKGGTVKEFLLSKVRWSCSDAEKIPRQNVNLLVGLLGKTGLLQELGVLKSADPSRGKAWIYCGICTDVESIEVGMVRVREDGRELEPVNLWSERSAHQGD